MWEIVIGVPIIAVAGFIQVGFFGQIRLLGGTSDLILLCLVAWAINEKSRYSWILVIAGGLLMSYVSAMPMRGYIWMYLLIWVILRFIKMRVWQMPMILMLFVTIIGTLIISIGTLAMLFLQNASVNYLDAFQQIIVPSLAMNLLLAIPVYAFLNDVINTIYGDEETE
ncbi:MAG: hypothetical protein IJI41_09195 [Anaerolineaceae bacterium]|nr:hypothetical protein [Anaerolineaceae bacterium]